MKSQKNKRENCFNIFRFYTAAGKFDKIGVVIHSLSGSDDEKLGFLKSHVENDLKGSITFCRAKNVLDAFDELESKGVNVSNTPILVDTAIVDGKAITDRSVRTESMQMNYWLEQIINR